jgi:DNA-binding transcriptional regulator YiaG
MTNTQTGTEALLKTDTLQRVRTPPARLEQLLDEFERSGLSGPKFAALAGIKCQTFAAWALKRRQGLAAAPLIPPASPSSPGRWLEAMVQEAAGSIG